MPGQGQQHADEAAVEGHAAFPHRQDIFRVAEVIAGFVEQHLAQAPAQHHAEDAPEQQVVQFGVAPAGLRLVGCAGGQAG
jgi:hypothetical protein